MQLITEQPAPRPCDVCGYERYDLAYSMRPGRRTGYWLCLACREDETQGGGFSDEVINYAMQNGPL